MKTLLVMAVLVAFCQPVIPEAHADTFCEHGLMALGPTSCAFAFNVSRIYFAATGGGLSRGPVTLFNVYSPATNASYVMQCNPVGSSVVCTGGNGAVVSIS